MLPPPQRQWVVAPWSPELQRPLIGALDLNPVLAQLLINRGITDPDAASAFLKPRLSDIPDPFLLPDMHKACARIVAAIRDHEAIVIYGDYDVDGTSGTAVLLEFLQHYGANVTPYLPHRERDGYGLQLEPMQRLAAEGARVLITCDNGTSSHEAIEWACRNGVDVVVTDHHSLPDPLPPAVAVVNPLRLGDGHPWSGVCGAGLAFALALGLRKTLRDMSSDQTHPNLKHALDLVTLGTIADVVPVTGLNRTLVWHGLKELATRRRHGLAELLRVSGVGDSEALDAQTVGFRLGPRLNAAGRIAEASAAVELMCSRDQQHARQLAGHLEDLNLQRRAIEERVLAEAMQQLAAQQVSRPDRAAFVLAGRGWHPGVIGIVAARIVDATHRPAFVIAINDGEGKGSGRSVEGVDLYQALLPCADLLKRFGGHPMAAGLTVDEQNLPELARRLETACLAQAVDGGGRAVLRIDAWLPAALIDEALIHQVQALGPFGPGNPEPVFATDDLGVVERRTVGKGHLQLRLKGGRRFYGAIGFRMAELQSRIPAEGGIAVAHSLQFNHWQGRASIQLRLSDLLDVQEAPSRAVP